MIVSLKNVGFMVVILAGIALFSCSDAPPGDIVERLILQSHPDIRGLEIMEVGGYDNDRNRLMVRAKYLWTPHSAWREECVTDFIFFRDIGTGEWKLHPSTISISRKYIP